MDRVESPEQQQTTVDALIAAGRRLFAECGFDGASVRAITAAAGANLAAITYHFGSKERFYARVVESTVGPFAERVIAAASAPGAPLERVEAVVRVYFDHLAAVPELPKFMLQGLVLGGALPEAAAAAMRRGHAALTALIREGQAAGSMRPGNAMVMAISIVSQPIHLMLVQRALRAFTGLDLNDPAMREEVVENAVKFARAGLAVHTEGQGR